VLEKRVLKKMFEPEREEITGDWRTLCNEKLHDLNCAPNVKMIKLRRLRCVGHVGRTEVYTVFY